MSNSQSFYSSRTLVLCAIAVSLLSSALTLFAVHGFGYAHRLPVFKTDDASHRGDAELGEEINKLIPKFPRVNQVQQNTSEYGVYTDHDLEPVLHRWQNFFPLGDGLINVPEYSYYNLPPPMIYKQWKDGSYTDQPWYSIAVFHQLHCLTGILDDYVYSHHPEIAKKRDLSPTGHVLHCFDYIREAIMCHADTALEGADPARGVNSLHDGTFGTGTTHVCKDWKAVFEYAEKNGNASWGKKSSGRHHHHGGHDAHGA